MRITPPAGLPWTAALWTAQTSQALYYAATNRNASSDTPVQPVAPVEAPTDPPQAGPHRIDLRV